MFGVNLYHKQQARKRPGRHKKSLNKQEKRQKKRGWQVSYINLYIQNERKNKLKFSDKLLSVISSFTIIFLLCYLVLVTKDLNNVWGAINDSATIIKKQDKKIRDLQILFITMNKNKGTSIWKKQPYPLKGPLLNSGLI